MNMDIRYLFADRPFGPEEQPPCDKGLRIPNAEAHMYGHALLPGGRVGEKHPCVILLHGLPGYTTNQDMAQALRRIGFVVLNLFYRGAWGSQGWFSLSGAVEDVTAAVQWCRSLEAAEDYDIDGERLFLVGISLGGWAAINGLCRCGEVSGAVAIAPADIAYLEKAHPGLFENAYKKYGCLHIASEETLMKEAAEYGNELGLRPQLKKLKGRPLLIIGGSRDTVIPPEEALQPLWETMEQQDLTSDKEFVILDAPHSFANCRFELTRQVAQWLYRRVESSDC